MSAICPNCGVSEVKELYATPSFDSPERLYDLGRCPACHLTSTLGVTATELAEAYEQPYYGSEDAKFDSWGEMLVAFGHARKAKNLLKIWSQNGSTAKPSVLDIGCGRGLMLTAFAKQGASVAGIERSPLPIDPDIAPFVHVGPLEDAPFSDRQFDIIVIWHVLEHMPDPEKTTKLIAEKLAAGGIAAVAVPNFSSFQARAFGPGWFHLDTPRHLWHFEREWLLKRLNAAGLEIEQENHFDMVQNIYGFIQSCANRIMPTLANEMYELIKAGGLRRRPVRTIAWLSFAAVLTPFALAESLISTLTKRGATLQVVVRKKNDQR